MPAKDGNTYDVLENTPLFQKPSKQSFDAVLKSSVVVIGILSASTLISFVLRIWGFTEANYILTYILGILFIAYFTRGYVYGIAASTLSVLVFNFYFTEPYYSLDVHNPDYLVTFAIMLVASLITSTLTTRIRFESRQAAIRESRIRILYQIERHLLSAQNTHQVLEAASNDIFSLYGSSIIITSENGHFQRMPHCLEGRDVFDDDGEKAAYTEAYKSGNACGAGTELFSESKAYYQPIVGKNGVLGVVGIVKEETAFTDDQRVLLETILAQVALAIEREHSNEKQRLAQMEMEREKLRSDLLRSISHDLRTPLTGILGSASTMIENFQILSDDTMITFLQDIYEDADWLKILVENVLSMTRLSEGKIALKRDTQAAEELISGAISRLKSRLQNHSIAVSIPDEMLMVCVDGMLIEQVIVNILDNAVKYTPDRSTVSISATVHKGFVWFEFSDDGPGIPEEVLSHIFDRFTTHAVGKKRSGIGLGLSICKSIIEAHGGEITAQNNEPTGMKIMFSLPMKEANDGAADSDRRR